MLKTPRLTLRNWKKEDAEALYALAKDADVATSGGWPVHTSVEMSRDVIETIFNDSQIYAIELNRTGEIIGCVGAPLDSSCPIGENHRILGYWLGKDFFNNGYATEAVKALIAHVFNDLACPAVWCTNFLENIASARVQQKCGFKFHRIDKDCNWGMDDENRKVEVRLLENPVLTGDVKPLTNSSQD